MMTKGNKVFFCDSVFDFTMRLLLNYLFLFLALSVAASPLKGESLFGSGFDRFIQDNVSTGGFIENTTGLAISHGSRFFDTSNRFDMNRFTIQPEFNVKFADELKLFLSWRFVKEPRYRMESESREQSVQPAGNGRPLPSTFYDEYSPVPWEAVLDYKPSDKLTFRWGRQFISWGETDGIRLLDLINPQDSTFAPPAAPNLFNLDETRIPSWGLRALYTVRPESNTILEFFALPGSLDKRNQRVDEVVGSNDTSDRTIKYGRWSVHPETRIAFGRLFANPVGTVPVVIPKTQRDLPDAGDSWKLGARVTQNFGKLNLGLGYIWGFNPQAADMVFKMKGVPTLCGSPVCPPNGTLVRLNLINDRTNIFAGHFNYPLGEILSLPVNTTVRGELTFFPDKPYNISEFPGRNCQTGALTGLFAGPSCKHPSGVAEKHTLRYALGFDRTTLIPFLHPDDPWRAFNISFQVFQSIIFDHEDGIRPFSSAERIKSVSTTFTFRAGTGYLGDTILPDIFIAYDPDGYYAINPAISYAPPWNERIRVSLIGAIYGGRNKFKSFGFFSEKDSLFLKLRYQF
jgi:hypothetical protein